MVKRIFLMGLVLLVLVASCFNQSCEDSIRSYAEDNNLTEDNVKDNGRGFWWAERDNGEQLETCLESGGNLTWLYDG